MVVGDLVALLTGGAPLSLEVLGDLSGEADPTLVARIEGTHRANRAFSMRLYEIVLAKWMIQLRAVLATADYEIAVAYRRNVDRVARTLNLTS